MREIALRVTDISIHALREESDVSYKCASPKTWIFQSTLSVRRATCHHLHRHHDDHISIHALREESD